MDLGRAVAAGKDRVDMEGLHCLMYRRHARFHKRKILIIMQCCYRGVRSVTRPSFQVHKVWVYMARYFRLIKVNTITAPVPLNNTSNDFETPIKEPR